MTLPILVTTLVNTVQIGSMYALMALGITLTMTVLKLPNFAHAEYITFGAYTALLVSMFLSTNPMIILVLAFVVSALVALVSHLVVFRPLEKRNPSTYALLLASFAVGLILRYILFIFADHFNLFDKRPAIPLQIWFRSSVVILSNIFFWVVPTSIVVVILLSLLLNLTALGREMRALANNVNLAKVIGIRVERVKILTWLLVGGLAGVAGALWGIYSNVHPLTGWLAILSVFAAAILGGMSSFVGTILGAYVVAFSENTIMQALNQVLGLDFSFKPAIPFIIIVLVLMLRPQGLTGFFSRSRQLTR
ncbi:MAG TPA: branched-chain amino acid ABC transporter permease [Phototrophicaceae bacterium]|nr:branched-chain amino acid ABC transporter permease [Phototrophicaceae bacterium]